MPGDLRCQFQKEATNSGFHFVLDACSICWCQCSALEFQRPAPNRPASCAGTLATKVFHLSTHSRDPQD